MEKRLIVGMAYGEQSRRYSEITFPLIQKYAQKCNADFHIIYNINSKWNHLGYQKFDYIHMLHSYNRILHLDADMIVRSNTPNIFDLVCEDEFAGVDEYPFQNREKELPLIDRYSDMLTLGYISPRFYINVGMYLFSKHHRQIFTTQETTIPHYKEQSLINYRLHKLEMRMKLLSPQFNFMSIMEWKGLKKEEAYIIHYAGGWGGKPTDDILKMMKEDIR